MSYYNNLQIVFCTMNEFKIKELKTQKIWYKVSAIFIKK